LARAPDSGQVLYGAACVAAWVAKRSPDLPVARQARGQALDLLARAFARGYGRDRAATDPDLVGVRDDPEVQRRLRTEPAEHKGPSAAPGPDLSIAAMPPP